MGPEIEQNSLSYQGEVVGASRRPKHIEISDQIDRLEMKLSSLQDLIDEITGASPEKIIQDAKLAPPRPVPTLVEVLNTTPERVSELSARLEDMTIHLRDLLI